MRFTPFTNRARLNQMPSIGGWLIDPQAFANMTSSQLQSTLSSQTSGAGELPEGVLHHPITCADELRFEEDGTFSCAHFSVPPDDKRTKACLVHSIALLIIEEAFAYTGEMKELPFERYE